MRKLRNKLLLSILTVALTFIALGTTTFAWFTLGGSVTAEAFSAQVKTADGIEISLGAYEEDTLVTDATKWEWSNKIDLSAFDVTFADLTSADGKKFLNVSGEEVTDGFAEIKFFVRTTKPELDIFVEKFVGVTGAEDIEWIADYTFNGEDNKSYTKGQPYNFDAINAVRLSFVHNSTAKVIEIASTNNQGTAKLDGASYNYLIAKGNSATIPDGFAIATPEAYYTGAENLQSSSSADTKVVVVPANSQAKYQTIEAGGTTYTVYEVTLYVWLEAWDADCINAILGQTVSLGFELKFE